LLLGLGLDGEEEEEVPATAVRETPSNKEVTREGQRDLLPSPEDGVGEEEPPPAMSDAVEDLAEARSASRLIAAMRAIVCGGRARALRMASMLAWRARKEEKKVWYGEDCEGQRVRT